MKAGPLTLAAVLAFFTATNAAAQKYYTYITDLGPTFVEISWGTTDGDNTIGRTSTSHGDATVHIAGRTLASRTNSITAGDLQPDHTYPYDVVVGGHRIGAGEVRTWPANANKLAFFVIGDYGTGRQVQFQVAAAMWDQFQKRAGTDNPIRFIISTGDNIYGNLSGFLLGVGKTGASDRDWTDKFFEPYSQMIARVPFFPSLGNHDGNETENRDDLKAYLDNFAFPGGKPARWYHFNFGGLAEFFALDSTRNTEAGASRPVYLENGPEFRWMQSEMMKARAPWVIPFYHHPMFNAGPLHAPSLRELQHWLPLFRSAHVRVVFNGHEHNFQMTSDTEASDGVRFFTSGAGGELRPGDVRGRMHDANIAAWAPQNHFLLVEIEGRTMRVTPLSFMPVHVVDADGNGVNPPFVVELP